MNPIGLIPLIALLLLTGCAATGPGMVESSDLLRLRDNAEDTYQEERYAEALPLFQSLAEQVPQDADIWFRLGNIHARLNQPRHAIHAYEEALVREPRRTKAWHNLGVIHLRNAVNAYSQLCANASDEDPLCQHAMKMLEGLNGLLARPLSPPSPSASETARPVTPEEKLATEAEPDRPSENEPAREESLPEGELTEPTIVDEITSADDVDPADIPGGSESRAP